MKTRITQWGNSLGLRISKTLAREIMLTEGDMVDCTFKNGKLTIEKEDSYEKLLGQINPSNLHEEITVDGPKGNELW